MKPDYTSGHTIAYFERIPEEQLLADRLPDQDYRVVKLSGHEWAEYYLVFP